MSSTPSFTEFNPRAVPYQWQVIKDIRHNFDYTEGVHEVLLSGSVGSAKSILMAHLAISHAIMFPRSRSVLGRKSMPDLKETLLAKILEHMEGVFVSGEDYVHNATSGKITFYNGSEILCRSWGDKKYKKARSLELSAFFIEELTENDSKEFLAFYKEFRARVGRLSHVPEHIICAATNPDAPSHEAYDYFINTDNPHRHVYYSVTTDNPFLPDWYIEQLKTTYTEKETQRMIYGQWIEIQSETVYYAFTDKGNVIDEYKVDPRYPICICYDFNIGYGKPMSACLMQFIDGVFYVFDECIMHGSRTLDTLEDMDQRGLLDYDTTYYIHGDATGRSRNTASIKSDYDIIEEYLSNKRIITRGRDGKLKQWDVNFKIEVPTVNPPIKTRQNLVNGKLENAHKENRVKILKDKCPMLIKGLRLTKLKRGAGYIEDDTDEWQHVTTSFGYGVVEQLDMLTIGNRFSQGRTQ